MTWASADLIMTWNEAFPMEEPSPPRSPEKMMESLESLLLSIRRDLGHDDALLAKGELMKLILVKDETQG